MAGGLGAAAALALPFTASAPAAAADLVPIRLAGPTGPLPVGAVELHLVDPSRTDPWSGQPREVMVTVTYPAVDVRDRATLPWLPAGAERALKARFGGAVDGYALPETHSADRAPARPGRRPVLLHSPGYMSDRTFNTLLIEELASWGYVVAAVDHPHDSGEVEFPDGRVVLSRTDDASQEARTAAVLVRAADLRFVLDAPAVLDRGGNPRRRGTPAPARAARDAGPHAGRRLRALPGRGGVGARDVPGRAGAGRRRPGRRPVRPGGRARSRPAVPADGHGDPRRAERGRLLAAVLAAPE
ncbi:hypothetical protein ACIBJF_01265 [Streptomyces sp. NPDC050743]|uniref:alpha/beta hydrolase n=1 Tax=Streptomyces sp. NPDC050743 TaxID=3365634 RepID=UPI003796BD6B